MCEDRVDDFVDDGVFEFDFVFQQDFKDINMFVEVIELDAEIYVGIPAYSSFFFEDFLVAVRDYELECVFVFYFFEDKDPLFKDGTG